MPPRRNRKIPPRPPVMTWPKAMPIIILAGIFDLVRAMCEQLWFFGPAIVGVGVGVATGSSAAGTAAGVVSGFLGIATGASAWIEMFGILMAMAVGFIGWATVHLLLYITNHRIFKEEPGFIMWMIGSIIISEIPMINSLPALTTSTWHLYHSQIKKDKAALKKWESEYADALRQEQRERAEKIRAVNMQQLAAQNDALALEAAEAANDNEIPEEGGRAA